MESMEERELTCITCPIGCTLKVTLEDGVFASVTGNRCKKGAAYAYAEMTHPTRVLTTTMAIEGDNTRVLPVKSDRPLPKEKWREAMAMINRVKAVLPITIGDVVLADVCGGNIVATRTMRKDQ